MKEAASIISSPSIHRLFISGENRRVQEFSAAIEMLSPCSCVDGSVSSDTTVEFVDPFL